MYVIKENPMLDTEYFVEIAISDLTTATLDDSVFDDIESELLNYFHDLKFTCSVTGNRGNQGWTVHDPVNDFSSALIQISLNYPDVIFLVKAYSNDCVSFVYFKNGKLDPHDIPIEEPVLSTNDLHFED